MRLGYACVNTLLPSPARTVRLANATPERLLELAAANLDALELILRWNAEHRIQVFRLTSNLIPLASHPANTLAWWDQLDDRFATLAGLVERSAARLSTHPGQYTVLSSQSERVVAAAVAELDYHDRLLTALRLDRSHKIVLHVGSGGADPAAAAQRFSAGFERLSPGAQARLVLENDERWPLDRVLELAAGLGTPVVFDAFHHELAPSFEGLSVRGAVLAAAASWRGEDGRQEVHYSTQEPGKRRGAHARTIDVDAFATFADAVGDLPLDCVLEVKDKEQSVLRARGLLSRSRKRRRSARPAAGRAAPPAARPR
jgi:UV DNA damage endonuclease